MNKAAVLHIPMSEYSFAYGENELRIRLRTAKSDVKSVEIIYAVKYEWLNKRLVKPMKKSYSDALFDYYTATLDVPDTRIGYVFYVCAESGEKYYYSEEGLSIDYDHKKSYYNFFQYPYINSVDVHKKIENCDSAVFYQIFVDRFAMGDAEKDRSYITNDWAEIPTPKSFHGGDLKGITSKLGYLSDLGVDAVYLTPVFASESNHKYDTLDYYRVDPMFGTNQDLKTLVDSAHKKGIKILLDAVFNHCSSSIKQFRDVLAKGSKSRYFDWFIIKGDRPDTDKMNYECFASCNYMPKWNTSNPEVQDFLIRVAVFWIKEYGIDGWRLDVADEVSFDFWKSFRKAVKAADPDAMIIGENWHNARPWLTGDRFDSIMNYSFTKACLDYFAFNKYGAQGFCDRLSEILMRNTDQVNEMMLNLLDSHDTERFLTNVGENKRKLKCALAVMFFFIGMPCIYYGTEIGMVGAYEPDSRRTFCWDEKSWDRDIFETVKRLIALKKTKIGGDIVLRTQGDLFVIERERATLVVNNTDRALIYRDGSEKLSVSAESYEIIE